MRQRLISAAVLVPVVVIVFLLGDPWLILGIALIAAAAGFETSKLVTAAGLRANSWFAAGAAATAVLGIWLGRPFLDFLMTTSSLASQVLAFIVIIVIVGAVIGITYGDPKIGFLAWAGNVMAALYSSLLAFAAMLVLTGPTVPEGALLDGKFDAGRIWVLILVLTVWALDSAAYISGRYFPRGHFMNHVSPHKTWSGVVGGTAAALLVCTYLVWAAGQQPLVGIILGAFVAIAAQAGDLAESVLKRAAGAKDSGSLIPGHGGILDRVDSFLFAAPVLVVVLMWLGLARLW